MTGPKIIASPDTTKCDHHGIGLDSPSSIRANFETGYCSACKNQIVFRLDGTGKRTGETSVVDPSS